ncbi:hypothetical protein IL306_001637 [Fusarium sp. DS 682]|nr:hypothetical protein IL306_001637 [Fusarium sp. DS 682]
MVRYGQTPTPSQTLSYTITHLSLLEIDCADILGLTDGAWRFVGGQLATGRLFDQAALREVYRRRRRQLNPTILSKERYPIEEFMRWRIYDGDCIIIEVRWADGSPDSWEPEEILHLDAARTLLNFWRRRGGRAKATGLLDNRILRILDKKTKKCRTGPEQPIYKCQWIGMPASDRYITWLSKDEVTDMALPQYVEFVTGVNVLG